MSLKRKRTQLTINNKLDIIKYYEENMRLKKQEIADYFNLKWQVENNRRTISDNINNVEKWKINEINTFRKYIKYCIPSYTSLYLFYTIIIIKSSSFYFILHSFHTFIIILYTILYVFIPILYNYNKHNI